MSDTHLRLGDQARVARLVEERAAAAAEVLQTVDRQLDAHAAGLAGAAGQALRAALATWLEAAHGIPRAIGAFAEHLGDIDTTVAAAQDDQAAAFERVARRLRGPG